MYGVIDIGSNTIRLSIYQVVNQELRQMFNKKNVTGLAGYIDPTGYMSERGIEKAIQVLHEFKQLLKELALQEVFVFATASLRNIKNTEEVLTILQEKSGFAIRILSGKEEALFDYYGAVQTSIADEGILVDIGGGSTELVIYSGRKAVVAESIPIGSLNMYGRFVSELIPSKDEIKKIRKATKQALDTVLLPQDLISTAILCGVGGTLRSACKLNNDLFHEPVENRQFPEERIEMMLKMLSDGKKNSLTKILQVVPERIHTVLPGMAILDTMLKYYHVETININDYGVREGYLYAQLQQRGELKQVNAL